MGTARYSDEEVKAWLAGAFTDNSVLAASFQGGCGGCAA